ncbi:glycoside hydrolase family 30 protein [Streptomyces sp. 6N223]|uniref:glycoside hydrolase family 30 protein n=1 Tax=Streptomyces sp. 6N223 TaxID=3457412 RepID=UPI003FD2D57F
MSTSFRLAMTGAVAAALATTLLPPATAAEARQASGTIDLGEQLQPIDGFGVSQAFQRAAVMNGLQGLTPENQQEVVDLLFSQENGAGLSILRMGIGSSSDEVYDHMKSIQPTDPGGPDAEPQYVWDGYDGGQVWLAKEAQSYGVERFYADAWSAPGYMKTNGSDANGGSLCGLPGASCDSGDWRQAYADYLVQYVRFYAEEGIDITDLGFTNEPDWVASYASMEVTPEQAADMVKVLGPTIEESEFGDLNLVCCDSFGWEEQRAYSEAIEADPEAAGYVDVHTGHEYASAARSPLPTDKPVWMSEWNPDGDAWTEGWDDGTGYDGMSIAEDIHATLSEANANAYVYWLGASIGQTRAFIQMDGADYRVSSRLWAMAAYSRFIRPDAVRVGAESGSDGVSVTAFRNADGSTVVEILNTGNATVNQTFDLAGGDVAGTGSVYLTDATHAVERTGDAALADGELSVNLPGRSLTTVVLD